MIMKVFLWCWSLSYFKRIHDLVLLKIDFRVAVFDSVVWVYIMKVQIVAKEFDGF